MPVGGSFAPESATLDFPGCVSGEDLLGARRRDDRLSGDAITKCVPRLTLRCVRQHELNGSVAGFGRRVPRDPRAFGNTGYTCDVAKVMISLPDELLARVDARASEQGSTRSATLRELAERALGERERLLAERMAEIDANATGHGGNVAEQIKAERPD